MIRYCNADLAHGNQRAFWGKMLAGFSCELNDDEDIDGFIPYNRLKHMEQGVVKPLTPLL